MSGIPHPVVQRRALGERNENVKSRLPKVSKLPVKGTIPIKRKVETNTLPGIPKGKKLRTDMSNQQQPLNRKRKVETADRAVPGIPMGKKLRTDVTTQRTTTRQTVATKTTKAPGVTKRGLATTGVKKPLSSTARSTKPAPPAIKKPIENAKPKKIGPAGTKRPTTNGVKSTKPGWDLRGQIADLQTLLQGKDEEISVSMATSHSYLQEKEDYHSQLRNLESRMKETARELADKSTRCVLYVEKNELLQRETISLEIELSKTKATVERKDIVINDRDHEIDALKHSVDEMTAKIRNQNINLIEAEETRKHLHNTVQELKGNIRVYCRVRPLLSGEDEGGEDEGDMPELITYSKDEKAIELMNLRDRSLNKTSKKLEFSFDHVFGPASTQSEVFSEISQLVQSALDGYNVCIFAYGQTGSGKTFTMEGPIRADMDHEGMIPRAVSQIFLAATSLQDKGWQFEMEATFLEIYNEVINDLLGHDHSKKPEIHMVGGKSKEVEVTNIEKYPVTSEGQVAHLLVKAAKNRAVASTAYNERSSRSHSIFRLKIAGKNSITGDSTSGTLNLVDLAGSERLPEAGYEKERLKEMKNINQSLSNLGKVILALSNKESHIPYRNCKLTHLLQDSLGGNSKTLMFVNVSPIEDCFQETLCSLRFAVKVNNCNIGTAQKKVK